MTQAIKSSFEEESATWFSTSELLEYLGISEEELDKKKNAFIEGVHFVEKTSTNLPTQVLWRIDRVDELLCLPIPPLEREAMLNAVKNKITCHK